MFDVEIECVTVLTARVGTKQSDWTSGEFPVDLYLIS